MFDNRKVCADVDQASVLVKASVSIHEKEEICLLDGTAKSCLDVVEFVPKEEIESKRKRKEGDVLVGYDVDNDSSIYVVAIVVTG